MTDVRECVRCIYYEVDVNLQPCSSCLSNSEMPGWVHDTGRGDKECSNCSHYNVKLSEEPCKSCINKSNWLDEHAGKYPEKKEITINIGSKMINCTTCSQFAAPSYLEPCNTCRSFDKWQESKVEVNSSPTSAEDKCASCAYEEDALSDHPCSECFDHREKPMWMSKEQLEELNKRARELTKNKRVVVPGDFDDSSM